jgi:hypothetical protein
LEFAMKRVRARAALAACLLALSPLVASALDEDEYGGYAADTLTVKVGYFGGPYYEKAVFALADLWAMDVQYADYTFIDNMPSVVIDHVAGVALADVTAAAGIDLGSVQSFNFWTKDKEGSYYTSLTKSFLIDTPRYCYYSLPDNFDYDAGAGNDYATADAARVPTLMALADDWNRALAGASFGSDYLNLNTNTRFRLIFGQTDARTRTASNSAKWVHSIEVTLGGAPTLTTDRSVLDLEVGSKFRSEASVVAADPAISKNATVTWRSSDERVATVDESGEITVHTEGSATITASFGGASASVLVNGGDADGAGNGSGAEGEAAEQAPPEGETAAEASPAGEAAAEASPAIDAEASAPAMIGREISVLPPPKTASEGTDGGVQNWRTDEMAAGAAELPIIREDDPAVLFAAAAALAFLLLGALFKFTTYKKEIL